MSALLPTEEDFGASPADPDATEAWHELRGRTIGELAAKMAESTYRMDRHFFAMGERAFCYYFPAVDRYLRSLAPPALVELLSSFSFSAKTIVIHFDRAGEKLPIHDQVVALCDYVLDHFNQVDPSQRECLHENRSAEWQALRRRVIEDGTLPQSERPRLKIPEGLPSRLDFGHELDARCAWENFGGKTLEEAYEFFCELPDSYAEDFMWMGDAAFVYYFPVIDRYLRSLSLMPEDDYPRGGDFLAYCVGMHFPSCWVDMRSLHKPVLSLCDYVLSHLDYLDWRPEEQAEIARRWIELREKLADDAREPCAPRGQNG